MMRKRRDFVNKVIYVHLDTISNSVLTKGITVSDFQQSLTQLPENILMLTPESEDGEFETHTGLRIVKGPKVEEFFNDNARHGDDKEIEWIDFTDVHLVKQLTPIEISELLYFGHMRTHLHSPFFYKLQNNYVFLKVNEKVNKIYYRNLEEFYHLLATKVNQELHQRMNRHRGWFKKEKTLPDIDINVMKTLRPILQEGIVFHFENATLTESQCRIPIYLVEDRLRNVETLSYGDRLLLAELIFEASTGWKVIIYEENIN